MQLLPSLLPFTTCLLATCFAIVAHLAYYSALKIKATHSFENSAAFQRTTRPYVPEDLTLHLYTFLYSSQGVTVVHGEKYLRI
jgi:hypothetical protein